MKKLGVVLVLYLSFSVTKAQNKPGTLSVGFNPLSLAETGAAFGPTVSYRVSDKIELWAEASYIFNNNYFPREWEQLTGARLLFQTRYFFRPRRRFFIAPELRYKSYSFTERQNFRSRSDTLFNFNFRERQTLFGGGVVVGWKFNFNRKKTFYLEPTAGLGFKQRFIQRQNVPAGYSYLKPLRAADSFVILDYETEKTELTVPISVRLVFVVGKK